MRLQLRFHHLLSAILALFLLALTAAFLYLGYGRLAHMAEENAGNIFTQIAARNAARLETMLGGAGSLVRTQASLGLRLIRDADGNLTDPRLLDTLLAILARRPEFYSLYIGLDNDDFIQAIGVRDDASLRNNLDAPPGTWSAIRLIQRAPEGRRIEEWRFLDASNEVLASRRQSTDYHPRSRPWFILAQEQPGLQLTEPYFFASSGQLGVTLTEAFAGGGGVFAVDLRLHDLGRFIAADLEGQEGGAVIFDDLGRVLAFEFTAGMTRAIPASPLQWPDDTEDPYLKALLAGERQVSNGAHIALVDGQTLVYAERDVELSPGRSARIAAFSPIRAFSEPIVKLAEDLALIGGGLLLIGLPLGYIVARNASAAVSELARDAERIKRFDFSGEPRISLFTQEFQAMASAQRLMKASLQKRTAELRDALEKLQTLVDHGLLLAAERDPERLLERIEQSACKLTDADVAELFLQDDDGILRSHNGRQLSLEQTPVTAAESLCVTAIRSGQPALNQDCRNNGAEIPLLAVPLRSNGGELLGVLQLSKRAQQEAPQPLPASVVQYVEAFAAQAATAFENQQLLKAQTELIDAMVRMLAGAIDAKSPYTGSHCARVPELAQMIAKAACASQEGKFANFDFDSAEAWREFRIAAWLHDCGKVTTPAYVMDKASKLETLYNRLHEIRTRFEVLLRDARIDSLQARLEGADATQAEAGYRARAAELQSDFAFVAQCNLGSEAMDPAAVERLQQLARQTWWRHFDDRIGLSHAELALRADCPRPPLPALEPLLGDHPWHIVLRPASQQFGPEQGFHMEVPEYLYNFGELYNLSTLHGTLTAEERFKINEHVIQSILMLEALPLPSNLKHVPEYAGNHHETLDGTGYPRRLHAGELSIPARIMAIADIFEALTAADRPYKSAKKLSEAVNILVGYAVAQHIDAELLALFLRSGVYLDYARQYLSAEQIDSIDLDAMLERLAPQIQPPAAPEVAQSGNS